jgi:radical SAM superfamily enzyme YgiQ (UPF0313 family)
MGKAGFRFILYGLESANQHTLDKINKGVKVHQIANACKLAKQTGLDPHLTCMIGYPWETQEDAQRTIDYARMIFDAGWADTLQATIVIPYPGTCLYEQAVENEWLRTTDWARFDMKEPVLKTDMPPEQVVAMTQQLYKLFVSPKYIMRKLTQIRTMDDIRFIARGAKSVVGHLMDFSARRDAQ